MLQHFEVVEGEVNLQAAVFWRHEVRFEVRAVVVQFAVVGLLQPNLDDGEVLADGGHLAPL